MRTELPPSLPKRNWLILFSLFMFVFMLLEISLLKFAWVDSFGEASTHLHYLLSGLKQAIFQFSFALWNQYWLAIKGTEVLTTLIVVTLISLTLSILLTWILLWKKGLKTVDIKVKGGAVMHKKNSANPRKHTTVLKIHPELPLTIKQAEGNFFTFGAHGSGKSTLIKYIVNQLLREPFKTVFIFDEKREYTEIFFNKRSTYLIAPWDSRSSVWDIGKDLTNLTHFRLFASQLIYLDERQPTWGQGAREIFVAILVSCSHKENLSWATLSKWLNFSVEEWVSQFNIYHPSANKFLTGAEETVSSYVSNLSSNVGWIHDLGLLSVTNTKLLSLSSWLSMDNSKRNALIIQSHPLHTVMMASLTNVILQFVTNYIMARPDSNNREYWMVLDELGNIPKNDSLARWLSLGRSKGARTIAGTQSISQIKDIYGEQQAETILSLFKNHVVYQCGAIGKTADLASESLGQVTYERPSRGVQSDGSVNYSWHRFTENLVTRIDVVNLKNSSSGVVGFIKLSGVENVYKLTWPFDKSKVVAHSSILPEIPEIIATKKHGRLSEREV